MLEKCVPDLVRDQREEVGRKLSCSCPTMSEHCDHHLIYTASVFSSKKWEVKLLQTFPLWFTVLVFGKPVPEKAQITFCLVINSNTCFQNEPSNLKL